MNHLQQAIVAALEAGFEIMKIYDSGDFDVTAKGDQSPLTRADVVSHKIIERNLKDSGIPVLSEEGQSIPYADRKGWKQLWIVDPIDGTKEFIKRNGEFTVNIALIDSQIPVLGVVYAPAIGALYYAEKDRGSFKINVQNHQLDWSSLEKVSTSLPAPREDSIFTVVASRSHMSLETEAFVDEMRTRHGEVRLISKGSSLKLCLVAEGLADCYPRFAPTMEWDTAAGQAICIHAGLDVIDWNTQQTMLYNREELLNHWFLVK